jgi:hypothetical protein
MCGLRSQQLASVLMSAALLASQFALVANWSQLQYVKKLGKRSQITRVFAMLGSCECVSVILEITTVSAALQFNIVRQSYDIHYRHFLTCAVVAFRKLRRKSNFEQVRFQCIYILVCVYRYIYIYTHTYIYIHTCIGIHIYTRVCVCVCVYIYIYI